MDNSKYDELVLKELKSIYLSPVETRSKCNKNAAALAIAGFVVAFIAQYLIKHSNINQTILIIALVFSGFLIGLAFFYNQASRQTPYVYKYTTPNMDLINKRLNEITKT